jgi:hypothetical protein
MKQAAEIRVLLDRLAKRFEVDERTSDGVGQGWGQFLDDPRPNTQIGPYGTSAGLIVSALAERRGESLAPRFSQQMDCWWSQWKAGTGEGHRLLCQNLRLAMFYLALKTSHVLDSTGTTIEVKNEILSRMLPEHLWGNYWLSPSARDQTPRAFPSAILVIALTLLEPHDPNLHERLRECAEVLEDRLIGTSDLPILHAAAAAAAILAIKSRSISATAFRRIRAVALSGKGSLGDLSVYFFDYRYAPDEGSGYDRDYFIVPPQLMLGIAGYQECAPVSLRVRAESVVKALSRTMDENDGLYRTDPEQRISTHNQAWAAILLHLAASAPKLSRVGSRIWYWFRRESWLTDFVLPLLVLFLSVSANVYWRDKGFWCNVLTTISVVIFSGLFAKVGISRVLRGR